MTNTGTLAQASGGREAARAVIVLPGQTISLKNSKQIINAGEYRRIVPSKAYKHWAEGILWQLKSCPWVGYNWHYPVRVSFGFFRQTRHAFDYINLAQGPLDLLQEAGIIADDDMAHVIPGDWYWTVDKTNPRVELVIEEL